MASCKLQVAGTDEYISRSRANWLIAAGRARLAGSKLEILEGAAHCNGTIRRQEAVSGSRWSAYSGARALPAAPRGLNAWRMNGAAVNAVAQL